MMKTRYWGLILLVMVVGMWINMPKGDTWAQDEASPTPNVPQTGGDYVGTLFSGGAMRGYLLHIPPSYDAEIASALVLSLHGFTSDPVSNAQTTQFSQKADEENFVVVYPAGQRNPMGWYTQPGAEAAGWLDDVRFVGDLLDYLVQNLRIDVSRIYLVGFSNGGGMVHRLACDYADRIAAAATVVGPHFVGDPCEISRPVPMLGLYGRLDTSTKYNGYYTLLMAIPEWAQAWAERNGCGLEPDLQQPDETVSIELWSGCDEEADVILRTYEQGRHAWPADATDVIWDFFSQHQKALPENVTD